MSYYAEYLKERLGDEIIENEHGFVVFRYLNDQTVYIVDIFIAHKHREMNNASLLANEVIKIAKQRGCTILIGSVVPTTKNSTISLKVLLGYGMTLQSASQDFITFKKDI